MIIRAEHIVYVENGKLERISKAQLEIDDKGRIVGIGKITSLRYDKKVGTLIPQFHNAHIHILDLELRKYFKTMYIDDVVGAPYGIKYIYLRKREIDKIRKSIEYSLKVTYRTGTGKAWIVLEQGIHLVNVARELLEKYPIEYTLFLEPSIFHLNPRDEISNELIREVSKIVDMGYNIEIISPLNYSKEELSIIGKIVHSKNLNIMTHVSETADTSEENDLDLAIDILGADILVHCTYVEDICRLKGKTVVITPRSNMFLVGKCNLKIFRELENVRIGTDNVGLLDPDMWREARTLIRLGLSPDRVLVFTLIPLEDMRIARFQIVGHYNALHERDHKFMRELVWKGRTLGRIDGTRICFFH